MTEQEFERLQRRFGEDVSTWPAPYRQGALARLEGEAAGDAALDRLILEAADAETDEAAMARKVLARIGRESSPSAFAAALRRFFTMPAAASGFAALLLAAAIGGYVAGGDGTQGLDDALMAFALGEQGSGGGDLLEGLGEEERL